MPLEPHLDFNSDDFRRDAYRQYQRLRNESPVFLSQVPGQVPIWYVTGAAEVEQVLLDSRLFARDPATISVEYAALFQPGDERTGAMINNHMLNRDGEDHRRLRRLVNKAFTLRAIKALRPRVQQIADELLDAVAEAGRMELVSDYAFPLPIIVIAELLGVPAEHREDFRRWSDVLVQTTLSATTLQRCYEEISAYLSNLIAERRQRPRDDLISALTQVEEEGSSLSEGELCSMIVLLIVAGHETTVSMIGNAVLALLQHPAALQQVRDAPQELPRAIEELLRYDSAVERTLTRFVTEDTQLGGQSLQRGQLLITVLGAANRDESRFANADTLDLQRPGCPHMAFGIGIHHCLGASLARLEAEIALGTLLRRCPGIELGIATSELSWRNVPNFRSLTRLPVRWSRADAP